jgi:hypothetical protein
MTAGKVQVVKPEWLTCLGESCLLSLNFIQLVLTIPFRFLSTYFKRIKTVDQEISEN